MEEAFGYVIFGVVGVGIVLAIVSLAGTSRLYEQIGRGGLSIDEDGPSSGAMPASAAPVDLGERDDEIRQMLEASNARRERRGQAPLDVEEELSRLTRPSIDAALEAEIRDLVIARNTRRVRRGESPLDVDAEVARQVAELG